MKKNNLGLLFAVIILIGFSCHAQDVKNPNASLNNSSRKAIDINLIANPLLKGINNINIVGIYSDTLFLIANNNRLLEVDLKERSLSNSYLNTFISKKSKELNKPFTFFIAYPDCCYLGFWDEMFLVSHNGQPEKIFTNGGVAITWMERVKNGVLLAGLDTVKLISGNGKTFSMKVIEEFNNDFGFVKEENAICYQGLSTDSITEFNRSALENEIVVRKYAPLSLNKDIKEPFVSYSSDKYFIVFDYWKRNALYILKKDKQKNALVKTISLKDLNYVPTQAELQNEEGLPNFKICYYNGVYYAIALSKGKLKILPFPL